MMTKKPRSTEGFSTLDDFLSGEGNGLRRRFKTAELSDEEAERIASSRMDKRHDHLNKLLDPK